MDKLSGGQIQRVELPEHYLRSLIFIWMKQLTLDEKTQSKILENIFNIKEFNNYNNISQSVSN